MNHSLKSAIILALLPTILCGENNNLFIAGTAALLGGAAGAAIGYCAKSRPPHTLDALNKRADALTAEIADVANHGSI